MNALTRNKWMVAMKCHILNTTIKLLVFDILMQLGITLFYVLSFILMCPHKYEIPPKSKGITFLHILHGNDIKEIYIALNYKGTFANV